MSRGGRQPNRYWNDQGRTQGRDFGSYNSQPPYELAYSARSPGYVGFSRGDERGSRSARENAETHSVSGRSFGYEEERYRERRGMYDRSRERHENRNTERDANFSLRRSSSRSTYTNYETRFTSGDNGRNRATYRREARYQPIDRNQSHRREGNRNRRGEARDISNNRSENSRTGNDVPSSSSSSWNGRTSQQQVLVQPMEWNALREEISDNNEAREKQLAGQSTNQRESKNRALVERTGLVPGNHNITTILQTNPDATASKQGTSGVPVRLISNYFRVTKRSTWQLCLYRVDFTPAIENKMFQGGLLHEQIKNYGLYFFDGTMLYMMAKLEKDVTEFVAKGKKDDQHYAIKIKLVGLVPRDTYQYLHVWALLLRKCERALDLQLVGRNYYDPAQKIKKYNFNLELWPGFVTAIHQHENDILLCVDVSIKVMRTDTVYDIMRRFKGDRKLIQKNVLDMTVRTTYTNKTYRISDIDFNQNPSNEFDLKTGEKTSFTEYFANKYGVIIKDQHQPLLIIRSSQRQKRAGQSDIFALVPELCVATGFDDSMRTNNGLMKTVAQSTRLNPTERILKSQALIHRLQNNAKCQEIFEECEFQLDANPTKITGRRLEVEPVIFGGQQQSVTTKWTKELHSNEMYGSGPLHNWILIYPQAASKQTLNFVATLRKVARGMNYIIENPYKLMLQAHESSDYEKILDNAKNRNPQLIVLVLTTPDEEKYGHIKKYCIKNAIQSQVLLSDTIKEKKDRRGPSIMSVATKVVIQINCKLGGVPWMVKIPLKGLMTIGFDVFHNIKDKRKKSCGAIVATWDMMDIRTERISKKYYSAVSAHISGNDLSTDLALYVCQAVREYFELNKAVPKHILFYRGGVGEGQIPYVKEIEIKNILDGLSNYYGDTIVPLTFILVTRRINTRFFVENRGNNGEKYQNPQPGTVVDDVITKPEKHEFLLVSSKSGQGTVSPTNYNILLNNMGLSSDRLQRLTYKLTYLYYNWCGTLPVPAVCQYAHKLAFLVGNYGLTPPSNDLQKKLYFL